MLIPLYGFVKGDSMGVVVLVQDSDSLARVAAVLAQACEMRVAQFEQPVIVVAGVRLDPTLTVAKAELQVLDRIDLIPGGK